VGDDLTDLAIFEAVGCPMTPNDGVAEAKKRAIYVTNAKGGEGAVREICDLLVQAKAES
jgi:3-deoxy-D-manno-octulosonate 8-phosphate phosphatase (KDO 8-P phosphatase)